MLRPERDGPAETDCMLYAALASLLAALLIAGVAARHLVFPLQPAKAHLPALDDAQRLTALDLEAHVRAIASEPHNLAHPQALEQAALYIEETLAGFGYDVRWQVFDVAGHQVRNIEVVLHPADSTARTLVIGAHYDSADDSPGANDNGTGVAALLEVARMLSERPLAPKQRVRLVFFVNEEQPYGKTENMGSMRHARALVAQEEAVTGMIALETLGYFSSVKGSQRLPFPFNWLYSDRGDFVAFIGLPGARAFLGAAVRAFRASGAFPATGTIAPASIEGADLSDHWSYHQIGVPALMITDTALYRNPFYHQPFDTPDTVDYASLARITQGLDAMVRTLAA
jgi:hypothetical protein